MIDNEYVEIEGQEGSDEMRLVTRGVRGTEPASHDSGAGVSYIPPAIRKAVAARAAVNWLQSGRYSAYLPDTDDTIDKGDIIGELKETFDMTVDVLS